MPADARREPPSDAGHGGGRPPDGPPEEGSWAFARGLNTLLFLRRVGKSVLAIFAAFSASNFAFPFFLLCLRQRQAAGFSQHLSM